MKVIVGLGNPGAMYDRTRHNVGFWVVDELCRRFGVTSHRVKWRAQVADTVAGGEKVLLVKPQTYMNLSGESVREVMDFHRELDPGRDLIVVYDDMDLPPGHIRLREQGSAGGHNGVKSIIQHLGGERFARVRVGIGRPADGRAVVDHVLSPFSPGELESVQGAVTRAADAIEYALAHGFAAAMNRYNARPKDP
ncbi:aminoacyl-tRNA hydrolase [Alicyclobacillus sp.]|uniref:aminoacyl-tRNA hydrolase n=1 Tax=Alicyclobacillus sp. TaxID=61169 RepID=UPI0025BA4675|nr:aminoacyl-tRNA hydrolase [Alicyclobacillus sp.]MCL6517700.1 aminoacyl-tRNA hydrolase [Alicyclobacillus sp.]